MNAALEQGLHLGGVEYRVSFDSPAELQRAIKRLTRCHDHVFVVDQATGWAVGVSATGRDCLLEEFN